MPDERTGDRHAKGQVNFRLDPALVARLKTAADEDGRTQTAITEEAVGDWLDRRDRIAAGIAAIPPAPVFLAAEDGQPQPAGKNCRHRNMRLSKGICPDCQQPVGYK